MSEVIMRPVVGRDARGNTIRTTRIIRSHDWPTRERWAEKVRTWTRYFGDDDPVHVSNRVSDYMESHEIDALIAKLKARRSELGKQGKEIRKQYPHCFRRKDETEREFIARWCYLSEAEKTMDDFSMMRREIFHAISLLRDDDRIPVYRDDGGHLQELHELKQRYQAAYDAEENRIEAEYAARPIDDEAWAKELARRAEVERIDALPDSEWFVEQQQRYTYGV